MLLYFDDSDFTVSISYIKDLTPRRCGKATAVDDAKLCNGKSEIRGGVIVGNIIMSNYVLRALTPAISLLYYVGLIEVQTMRKNARTLVTDDDPEAVEFTGI